LRLIFKSIVKGTQNGAGKAFGDYIKRRIWYFYNGNRSCYFLLFNLRYLILITMKKSSSVLLSAFFIAFIASCRSHKEWVDGADTYGIGEPNEYQYRDTIIHRHTYRFYRGRYYPVSHNRIHVPYNIVHPEGSGGPHRDANVAKGRSSGGRRGGGFGSIAMTGSAHS